MNSSSVIRWMFCAAGTAAAFAFSLLWGWHAQTTAFFTVTVCALCLWISSVLPGTLVAMCLPVAYVLSGAGTPAQVLSPWTTPMCWLVLGGIVISRMMEKSGVSRRMALWALKGGGTSLRRLFWSIMLAGLLIAPFVPTVMGKAALFVVILGGICRTLELEPGGREASCVFLCGLLAMAEPKFLFFTSSVDSSLLMDMAARMGVEVSWLGYVRANALPGVVYAALCTGLLCLFVPRGGRNFTDFVEAGYRELGPVNDRERRAFVLLGLVALAMVTDSWHGIDLGWVMMAAALACFMPGVRLLEEEDLQNLPLGMVFFVAGCMSIGAAAQASGVDDMIGALVRQNLPEGTGLKSLLAVFASGFGMTMGFTTLPAVSTMGGALSEAALQAGSSGPSLFYAFLYGIDQFLMPYVFAPALYFYASGYIGIRYYLSFQSLKLVLTIVFLALVAIPWWSWLL